MAASSEAIVPINPPNSASITGTKTTCCTKTTISKKIPTKKTTRKKDSSVKKKPPRVVVPVAERFSFFSKLPPEIRIMIWNFHKQPRIVKIEDDGVHRPWFCAKIPSILHCNRESREIGLQSYAISFKRLRACNKTYFNFEIDLLDLSSTDYDLQLPKMRIFRQVKKAAVKNPRIVGSLSSLEELWVVGEVKQHKDTIHTACHRMKESCYVDLEVQSDPPAHFKEIHSPLHVLHSTKLLWNMGLSALTAKNRQRLENIPVHFVSPCRIGRDSYIIWGGENGCR